MAQIGELVWKIIGDTSGINKSTKEAETKVGGMASSFKKAALSMGAALLSAGVVKGLVNIGKASLQAAANMETQTVAFTTMLGSASKAQALIREVSDFAASTPFQLPEIIDASKKLVAFGESSETVVGTIRRLGDVSAGLSIPLGELTEIYGKARVQGTLFSEDLNQLAGRGIPIFTELAKVMGVNASEIKKLASEGKVGFTDLEQVFKNLTGQGGQFANLMSEQSATLVGKWSNFNDSLERANVIIGNRLLPTAKSLVTILNRAVGSLIEYMEESAKAADNQENLTSIWEMNLKLLDGTVGKLDEIIKLGGEQAETANIYRQYLAGNIKLSTNQILALEKQLQLSRSINQINADSATSELDSWRQRGLVATEVIENEKKGGKGLSDAQKQWAADRRSFILDNARFINENTKSETELLQQEIDNRIAAIKRYSFASQDVSAEIAQVQEIYSKKITEIERQQLVERLNAFNSYAQSIGGSISGLLSAFQAYNAAVYQGKIDRLDASLQAELEAAGVSEETTVEQAQREYDIAQATGSELEKEEKRRALVKAQIEEKYQKKKAQLEYEAALTSWQFQRAMAALQIPLAIMNAVASGAQAPWFLQPGFMIAMGSIAGITAGAQFAAVEASKPQAPKFAEGGIVPGTSFSGDRVQAQVNSGEMILNQSQQARLFEIANQGGGSGNITVYLGDELIYKSLYNASKRGDLIIDARGVVTR